MIKGMIMGLKEKSEENEKTSQIFASRSPSSELRKRRSLRDRPGAQQRRL